MTAADLPDARYRLAVERDALRDAVSAMARIPEPVAIGALLADATLAPEAQARVRERALALARQVRSARVHAAGADALMQAFSLSSDEGIALMCVAEALLRIPDADTADALIRDKIGRGDWQAHLGASDSLFVNAACWGLLVTGKLVCVPPDASRLARALTGALDRVGEPVIRASMRLAMRFLGEQFVLGETIEEALRRAREREALGYCYSYDMLGEAAVGAADAERFFLAYEHAIRVIGEAARGRPAERVPGISIKLSALHPRFQRSHRERVLGEMLPRLVALAELARDRGISIAIDAEEADRLDLTLDVIDAIAHEHSLRGFEGLGIVVQAYQKRAPAVIDWIVDLARSTRLRIAVRLVKGAYWDAEIKQAQVAGLDDYPVFTRKVHSDVSYLACARRLLAQRGLLYPQFATHNAATLAAVIELAGAARGFEFQCLHGMGEALYDNVVADRSIGVPCRIYAPVGTHATLLAYLVRRLLENGANTSFVNQVIDADVDLERLVADPVAVAAPFAGAPHPKIPRPPELYPDRRNSLGIDFSDERALAELQQGLDASAATGRRASPLLGDVRLPGPSREVRSPADVRKVVGHVEHATAADVEQAVSIAATEGGRFGALPAHERAAVLDAAANLIEANRVALIDLAVREAGKTIRNGLGEVREAADFCRYYARLIRDGGAAPPLGPVACVSPWNFPLAIFVGQVAGALAAGNAVLAKPAEQTPLTAFEATRLLHEAGVPRAALQLLPGEGETVGAALIADPRIAGVVFTGSTATATAIHRTLAARGNVPLIAETGGQNAMIVDSSALLEQAIGDAVVSAFDSAGQRCSALRVLFLQQEIADRAISMLAEAMQQLRVGDPIDFAADVGPIIDDEARRALIAHVERMDREARRIGLAPEDGSKHGHFLAPVAYEIPSIATLTHEVFGPVLHVVRYRSADLDAVVDAINATGYALTLGIESRIDATVDRIARRARAGNVYVNRNMIGAVVGVQPFGGEGLSGTGPKAGGPLYVRRLTRDPGEFRTQSLVLPGPTGEENRWRLAPRGLVVALGPRRDDLREQARSALSAGNVVRLAGGADRTDATAVVLEFAAQGDIEVVNADEDWAALPELAAVLASDSALAAAAVRRVAAREGARVPVIGPTGEPPRFAYHRLCAERTISINTTAAGGNASLLAAVD